MRNLFFIYCAYVVVHIAFWLSHISGEQLTTLAFHPSFSAAAWLMVGLVPIAFAWQLGGAQPRFLLPLFYSTLAVAVAALVAAVAPRAPYVPSFLIVALVLSLIADTRGWAIVWPITVALFCAAVSYMTGYRSYTVISVAAVVFLLAPPPGRIASLVILLFVLSVPFQLSSVFSYLRPIIEPLGFSLGPDTRTMLVVELFADMHGSDFVMGKGLDGTYYSPYFYFWRLMSPLSQGDSFVRFGLEIGVMNHLLKIGLLGVILFLGLLLTPVFLRCAREDIYANRLRRGILLLALLFMIELPLSADVGFGAWYVLAGCLYARASRLPRVPASLPRPTNRHTPVRRL